jgi:hypothetical protein
MFVLHGRFSAAALVLFLVSTASAQSVPSIAANGRNVEITADGGVVNVNSRDGLRITSASGQPVDVGGQLSQLQSSIAAMQSSIADMSTVQEAIVGREVGRMSSIQQLTARIDAQVNASTNGFASSEARLDALEYNYWNYTEANGIFSNGDFEDGAGAAANMSDLSIFRESVGGDGYSFIRLEDDDRPPSSQTHGKVLNYALRVGRSGCTDENNGDCPSSYRVDTQMSTHGTFCPGTYQFSAWARVTDDFNGRDQIFHHRFFFPSGPPQAYATDQGGGVETGAFPQSFTWERIQVSIRLRRPALRFFLAVGYPALHSAGYFDVTGVDVRRLGGDASC